MNAPGFWELLFLGVIALLIFGPERLPKMAHSAGLLIARLKREAAGTMDELRAAAELEEFSDVARDLRETTEDLRRSVDLSDTGLKDTTKPVSATMATAGRIGAVPFDPDTP